MDSGGVVDELCGLFVAAGGVDWLDAVRVRNVLRDAKLQPRQRSLLGHVVTAGELGRVSQSPHSAAHSVAVLCDDFAIDPDGARWAVAVWLCVIHPQSYPTAHIPALQQLAATPPTEVVEPTNNAPERIRQVLFAGVEHITPVELAAAFQQHWDDAVDRLLQTRDRSLVEETEKFLRHHHLDEAAHKLVFSATPLNLPGRFAELLIEIDPTLDPVYNRIRLTPDGLESAALEIINAGGKHRSVQVLHDIYSNNILTIWRTLPAMTHGPATQQIWAAAHQQLSSTLSNLSNHGVLLDTTQTHLAHAWNLACTLNPNNLSKLANATDTINAPGAAAQTWWLNLRNNPNPTPAQLTIAHLTKLNAHQQTEQQTEQQRQQQIKNQQQARIEADRMAEIVKQSQLRRAADARQARVRAAARAGNRVGAFFKGIFYWWLCCIPVAAVMWILGQITGITSVVPVVIAYIITFAVVQYVLQSDID